ncbi:MAG: hypothetical protein IJW37_07050 [Lachnospiraceae bacterium]|nr:hypothetical protein [Lachnospiraceae bacterium]
MKNTFTKILMIFLGVTLAFIVAGCGSSANDFDSISGLNPDKIVPSKEILVGNLEDNGYTTTEYTAVEGLDLMIDRIVSEKGNKFIDITYGLTAEEADRVFHIYENLYTDDYYILAINGNYVYCVSDKKTFSKAGFTTTANIGVQYIHE